MTHTVDSLMANRRVFPNRPPKHHAKRDVEIPCAICGWGKYMAIHLFPKETTCTAPIYPHEFKAKDSA